MALPAHCAYPWAMATLSVSFDTAALQRLDKRLLLLTDRNLRFVAAKALSEAGKAAQQELVREMPRFIDRPTRWTLGSTFVRYAKADDLETTIGVRSDEQGRGHAAGRYLLPIIKGTTPKLKGVDLSATKLGRSSGRAVVMPGKVRLNEAGNVTLSKYAAVLGSIRDKKPGSRYFVAQTSNGRTGIFQRRGKRRTPVDLIFWLDPNPKPRRAQLPLRQVVFDGFSRAWPSQVKAAAEAELARRLGG